MLTFGPVALLHRDVDVLLAIPLQVLGRGQGEVGCGAGSAHGLTVGPVLPIDILLADGDALVGLTDLCRHPEMRIALAQCRQKV